MQSEDYDFPGFDKAASIAQTFDHRAAWLEDSEGNLLVIGQLPPGAFGWPGAWSGLRYSRSDEARMLRQRTPQAGPNARMPGV